MRTVVVAFDGVDYEVKELRGRDNRAWRKFLEGHFDELAGALEDAPGTDIANGQSLGALVRSVGGKLLGSVDIVSDLVARYDASLPLDDAFDSEIMEAFTSILGLAYPFGSMIDQLILKSGDLKGLTSQN